MNRSRILLYIIVGLFVGTWTYAARKHGGLHTTQPSEVRATLDTLLDVQKSNEKLIFETAFMRGVLWCDRMREADRIPGPIAASAAADSEYDEREWQ